MSKDNGGPAFPQPILDVGGKSGIVAADEIDWGGMTIRDYFAAKAMQGHISLDMYAKGELWPKEIAIHAYELADAMLAERAK